ncbi:hypothetical protein CTheo_7931 [Ceratobasidium theobromae]|uniref:Effector protein n=1 Tax=Ceratobasidium theobromae TaxID=1582974 RepID=A0A5N5QB59_9AGAM|nr:hypothetical protein CTheo_7931 [Ceratobasidium theobromae]
MLAFNRFASFVLFVLSLSIFACAYPTSPSGSNALAARDQAANIAKFVANLKNTVDVAVQDIAGISSEADVAAHVGAIVNKVNDHANSIASVSGEDQLDDVAKADLAKNLAAIIAAIFCENGYGHWEKVRVGGGDQSAVRH